MSTNDLVLLPRASFQGLEFPVESVDVRGGIRTHLHEYPHWPSAALEKLGRKPYEITMVSNFQTTFRRWPGLWPKRLADLRDLFEAEASDYLVIPSIGKMWCCCTDWDQQMTAKVLSGEKATFKFIEDSQDQFALQKLVQVSVESLSANGQRFAQLSSALSPRPSIFDQVLDAVNSVMAVIDQSNAYGGLVEAKLLGLAALCKEADQRLELQSPINHRILDALHDLWSSALTMLGDTQRTGGKIIKFRVPRTMSVTDVSALVYKGDATRGIEILTLNPIDDAFAIEGGTVLKIYQEAA
jgi:prophage DNA circulation protein